MEIGTKLHGFTVSRIRPVSELGGDLVEMIHDKTKAQLCWMDNGEENKLFSIGFKTIPEDSTGVFHILEHSVLNGSEKYPVREPFVELLKSSMNTFLNAMTFPDKTVYPVSSRNEKDFLNLTGVYLDAVFAPLLGKNPNVFYQEGWHTELNDGVPSYKGVVFNEMKGAMSDVDGIIEEELGALLFPDNCYGFNSGGDPAHIPDLSYEQYVQTYQRFYHPSNSMIYLDGSIPVDATLAMIDEYLSRYEYSAEEHPLPMQQPRKAEAKCFYELSPEEDEENKVFYNAAKLIGTWEDRDKLMAAMVLCDILTDSNEAPLKRAILSAGLGEDMSLSVMDGIAQPYLTLQVRNTAEDKIPAIRETVRKVVSEMVDKGIEKDMLRAALNSFAFRVRQKNEPQGLYHAIDAMSSWLYGGDPILYLEYDAALEHLNAMAEEGGYEELLRELLLDEENVVTLLALPSRTYGEELRRTEQERLQREHAARTPEEITALEELNDTLVAWQQTADSPEALATLPTLPLSEVGEEPEKTDTELAVVEGVTVLHHKINTTGINYLSMYFSLADCTLDELRALSLLPGLMDELPTENYTVAQLQQEIKTYIGSLSFRVSAYAKDGETETCAPMLAVHASVLEDSWEKAEKLLTEILLHTRFNEPERIREFAVQANEGAKQRGITAGHAMGAIVAMSHSSARNAVVEATTGYTNARWIHDFVKNFDAKVGDFVALMERVQRRNICRAGLTASITTTKPVDLAPLISALPLGEKVEGECKYVSGLPRQLGIRIPAQAGFAAMAPVLPEGSGALLVASNILTFSYLWNEVRVQGGAYGTGFNASRTGEMRLYSYRDPSPERSLDVYQGCGAFLRDFCESGESLEKYIISQVSSTEPLRTPAERGSVADDRWFSGLTYDKLVALRRQMLDTNKEDLLILCRMLNSVIPEAPVCVVAPEAALKECDDLEIVEL